MKLIVNPHKIEIDKNPINEKEINITTCEFEFSDEITSEFVKEAYFTYQGTTYKQIIVNDACEIPYEVLAEKGQVELGVVAYLLEDEEYVKRYNPSPVYFNTWVGSLKDHAENSEPITPSEMEQYEQALQDGLTAISEAIESAGNLDIDAEKVGNTATITITKQDETQKSVEIFDGINGKDGKDGKDGIDGKDGKDGQDGVNGVGLNYNWQNTSLGVKRENEQNYSYVDLKGDQGDRGPEGAIKMVVVNSLPATGNDDTIYLAPSSDPSQSDIYEEYIYVNNAWERLGGASTTIDLSEYVKFIDYPTNDGTKSGVIKVNATDGISINTSNKRLQAVNTDYGTYQNASNSYIIGKGTLENVITGKGLLSSSNITSVYSTTSGNAYDVTYINSLVGDINSALDAINNEVI